VTICPIGERRALLPSGKPVHRHHLARLNADREEFHPIAPQLAKCFFWQGVGRDKRAEFGAKQHFCTVNIADSRDNLLVHERSADRCRGFAAPSKESFLAALSDEWIRTEFATHSVNAGWAEHFADCRPAKIGDSVGCEDAHSNLPDWLWREINGRSAVLLRLPHAQSGAARRANRRKRRFVFTDDRAVHIRLTDSPATCECRRIELHVSREVPRTVNPEVHVKRISTVECNKKVLANCICIGNQMPIEDHAVAEPTLRARHDSDVTHKVLPKLRGNAVNGMTLGHA
jgi:hypothetical protein